MTATLVLTSRFAHRALNRILVAVVGEAMLRSSANFYLRTSSAANVGSDKDSDRRQREAIASFAKRAGYELVAEFYDAAVSGADAVDSRLGFAAMLERIEGNGVRTIIVETASRFARDLMVQEVGHAKLCERGIDLIAADNLGSFIDDTPTAKLVRQVLGAISEFDKAMTVAKLRGARERKRRENGKCEGRKSHAELNPELVALVRQLRRRRPKGASDRARDLGRACGTRFHERARSSILCGLDCIHACTSNGKSGCMNGSTSSCRAPSVCRRCLGARTL